MKDISVLFYLILMLYLPILIVLENLMVFTKFRNRKGIYKNKVEYLNKKLDNLHQKMRIYFCGTIYTGIVLALNWYVSKNTNIKININTSYGTITTKEVGKILVICFLIHFAVSIYFYIKTKNFLTLRGILNDIKEKQKNKIKITNNSKKEKEQLNIKGKYIYRRQRK